MKTIELEKLKSPDPKIKYGYAKELLKIAANSPKELYDYFDFWKEMLDDEKTILKWTAIDILGYISSVDEKKRINSIVPHLTRLLHSGNLITCNHAIFALGLIAQNKNDSRNEIIAELLSVSKYKFDTPECRNIAIGKVLETLDAFKAEVNDSKEVVRFIKLEAKNSRNATKKKAEKLMRKCGIE